MAKRIGIDCRLAGTKHTGIGRYILALVPELVKQAPADYFWVLYFADKKQKELLIQALPASKRKQVKFRLIPIRHYSLKEQLSLAGIFNQDQLHLLHVPHFNKPWLYQKKTIITIHDLLWHKQRGRHVTTLNPLTYYFKYLLYRLVVNQAVASAKAIIVPSLTTKKDLLHYYPKAKAKTYLTYEGVLLPTKMAKPKKILPKSYLLYVGSLYPHKNIDILLKALSQTPGQTLVIVSARNIFWQRTQNLMKQLKLTARVIFFDWVSDAELKYLYVHAKALVQPSIHEGFGLTGIEALSLGTPVIASDIKVFHEVYQDAANFFSPQDVKSLTKLIQTPRQQLQKPSASQLLERYSWQKCAKETLKIYDQVLS